MLQKAANERHDMTVTAVMQLNVAQKSMVEEVSNSESKFGRATHFPDL